MSTSLKVEIVSLDSLHEDDRNPRSHDERNLDTIKASLSKFDQVEPLVVQKSTKRIIGGNGRFLAMRSLGWKQAQVVFLDVDDVTARALSITLNRTSELAGWDLTALSEHVRSLAETDIDLSALGWTDYELEVLREAEWKPPPVDEEYKPEESGAKVHSVAFDDKQWEAMSEYVEKSCKKHNTSEADAIVSLVCLSGLMHSEDD